MKKVTLELIKEWYRNGAWNKNQVLMAVTKGIITEQEADECIGNQTDNR